jgi:N-acetylmuramoyl-L-alanine amidase
MPDERSHNDENPQGSPEYDPNDPNVPASVTFMEMMRQAAARSQAARRAAQPYVPPPARTVRSPAPGAPADLPAVPPMRVEPPPAAAEPPPAAVASSAQAGTPLPVTAPPPPVPLSPAIEDDPYAAAREEQRIRRVKRRAARRRRRAVGVAGGILRSAIVVVVAAGLMATIFTWWTPSGFLRNEVRQELSVAVATNAVTIEPTGLPTPNWLRRVGIVSGHRGPQGDPGAVCPDGLTEAEINFNVAQQVVRNLRGRGYTVDLLDEFDPRLDNYQAAALISIHANTCQVWPGEVVSGYLIAAAAARVTARGNDDILVECVARHYGTASGLMRREGVTKDMTDYHTFREIHPLTPATILELGFMLADRDVLTRDPALLAQGITDGILCFLEPTIPTLTPSVPELVPTLPAAGV